jgi:hypothetical protein
VESKAVNHTTSSEKHESSGKQRLSVLTSKEYDRHIRETFNKKGFLQYDFYFQKIFNF